jgi:chemotaxis protein MotB
VSDQLPQKPKIKKSEELWLMSFSDMSLVLLCFFVLLVTMMEMKRRDFDNLQKGFDPDEVTETIDDAAFNSTARKISDVIKKKKIDKLAKVYVRPTGVYIEFKESIMFQPAKSIFAKEKGDLVDKVLRAVAKLGGGYHIVVEGHSDDQPYGKSYNENWELSSERAIAILRKLTKMGVKEGRISMSAYAHTRPKIDYVGLSGKALIDARKENRRVGVWLKLPTSASRQPN